MEVANSTTGGDWWKSAVRTITKIRNGQRLTGCVGVVVFAAPNQYVGRYAYAICRTDGTRLMEHRIAVITEIIDHKRYVFAGTTSSEVRGED